MDYTTELNSLVEAAHAKAATNAANGSFYSGSVRAEIGGHTVSCSIEPNTRNGRGMRQVVQKGWYMDGKRTSIARVVAILNGAA